jgi:hypothetical protein
MVKIIILTGAGHEEHEDLSRIQAVNFIRKRFETGQRFLIMNWNTQETISKDELDGIDFNDVIGLIPMVAGGRFD